MKSLRLSLMVYFLGLLALGLGAVSLLVYHTTHETLQSKKQAMEELIESQYQERCNKERERLDNGLLAQATALYRVVDFPGKPTPQDLVLYNTLYNSTNTLGRFLVPVWGVTSPPKPGEFKAPGPLGWEFYKEFYKEPPLNARKFNDQALDQQVDPQVADYCQINSVWGNAYRSPALRQDNAWLPFDPATAPNRVIGWEHDDVVLPTGEKLRRVTLTSPYPRLFRPGFLTQPSHGGGGGGRNPDRDKDKDKSPPRPESNLRPAIVVQCATDLSRLESGLAELTIRHEDQKAQLEEETQASLSALANRLLAISLATFAAIAVGGFALVRIGLAPLGRLSDAVSRVSEKDFRLQFGKGRLPVELAPIAGRLSKTLEQLSQAFAREKQVAADISHELRTPLAALLTTIDVTLRKPRSAEDYREVLQDCRSSGHQMASLVERLLVLARLDAGVDPLRKRSVDLSDLADQCITLVRPLAEARSLQLKVQLAGPTNLDVDPEKLREVLNNLLHNAIQYNRPNGSVELTVGRHNGCVRMQVRDTGIGIDPKAREHIFERFYRADPSRQTDGNNSGLGLAIVKGYVELMGGTIAVESTPGQGSTFSVDLPMHKA